MSRDKKLNRYAEERLAGYSGAKDSLARLKEEQRASRGEAALAAKRSIYKKVAVSLASVAAVFVLTFCLVWFSAPADSAEYDNRDSAIVQPNKVAPHNALKESGGSMIAEDAYMAADVNDHTEYVEIVLSDTDTQSEVAGENGYYYTFAATLGSVSVEGKVTFDEGEEEIETDRVETVAGLPFAYRTEAGTLRGKLETENETVYITDCTGGDEDALLDAVRTVVTAKE